MNRRTFLRGLSSGSFGDGSLIRVGNNENPYGPGPAALEALSRATTRAHRYPGGLSRDLAATISRVHDVPLDHILLSGGSGDVMRAAVYTFTSPVRGLVFPRPSYEAPMRSAQHIGSPVIRVQLTPALTLDVRTIASRSAQGGLVYICNPNNPTGTVVPAADLSTMIASVIRTSPDTRFLVDEAYFDYADAPGSGSMIPLAVKHPQVIVTRTFSKIHGMAGMRVAYAIAQPDTLAALRLRHSASSLGAASLAAAAASLADVEYLAQMAELNRSVRSFMVDGFARAGFQVAPADANFIFVNIRRDARAFGDACYAQGVQVGRVFPPLGNWARIAVGTGAEMKAAMDVFLSVLAAPPVPTRRG
ncbi:MAG: aminotransferase class I/II-fold pyridoxal phosphate-dependent enzyme [Vicinamibacterales bacterium]